jgi:hypothetical protein
MQSLWEMHWTLREVGTVDSLAGAKDMIATLAGIDGWSKPTGRTAAAEGTQPSFLQLWIEKKRNGTAVSVATGPGVAGNAGAAPGPLPS